MNQYVFDTDILTQFQEGHPIVLQRFNQHQADRISITVLSIEEQLSGWYTELRQAKNPQRLAWAYRRLAQSVRMFSHFEILEYDTSAMHRFANFRKLKLNIGNFDLRIAATVLEHQAILVTRNTRDFCKIPGLRIEDWSQ
jgi:tRNA(fMet)-specific endonuclease VapC